MRACVCMIVRETVSVRVFTSILVCVCVPRVIL